MASTQQIFGEQIKKSEKDEACGNYGEQESAYRDLVSEPERRPTGRPSRRWENDIKRILKKLDARKGTRLIWLRKGTSGGVL